MRSSKEDIVHYRNTTEEEKTAIQQQDPRRAQQRMKMQQGKQEGQEGQVEVAGEEKVGQ